MILLGKGEKGDRQGISKTIEFDRHKSQSFFPGIFEISFSQALLMQDGTKFSSPKS